MYRTLGVVLAALAFLNSVAAEQLESQIAAPVLDEQAKKIEDVQDVRSEQAVTQALQIHLGPMPQPEDEDDGSQNNHRIGHHRSVPSEFAGELSARLNWAVNEDGQYTAAVTLAADGAASMRVQVEVNLPVGGSLQVFDGEGQARGPAYTRADLDAPTWLPSAEGDTLTVQITLPSEVAVEALSFIINQVAHRYKEVVPQSFHLDCSNHQNASCASDENILDYRRATARIAFEKAGGTYVCSGTLLNVSKTEELEPYFLTAYHCISNASVASTIEAQWFYHYAECSSTSISSSHTTTFGGADWLAGSGEQDSSLLRFRRRLPSGLFYGGWSSREVPLRSRVFSVHHPGGDPAHYATGRFIGLADTSLEGLDQILRDALSVNWELGVTEPGSSGGGLFHDRYLVGVNAGWDEICVRGEATFGSFRDFYPQIKRWLSPDTRPIQISHLPLLSPAFWYPAVRGIVRVVNSSEEPGYVTVHAIDDAGTRFDPFEIELGPMQASQFSSATLEDSIGEGEGFWRLELSTNLDIRAQAFMRFVDNNLAPMHDVIPIYSQTEGYYWYHANKFFPAKHATHVSWLRLINPTASSLRILVVSAPDRGGDYSSFARGRSVWIRLRPHESRWLSSENFEKGTPGLGGRLGALTQGHHLFIRSTKPLWAMNLMRNPTGRFFNISTAQISTMEETE